MNALALPLIFTGAVIFVWGFRASRNRRVNVAFFKLRGTWSTLIFGISSVLCGFLMILSGAASAFLDAAQVEIMAKSGLYMFGAAWIIAFALEALARIGWRISPADALPELRQRGKASHRTRRKRKPTPPEENAAAGASHMATARRRLKTVLKYMLLAGSRLYHRVMLPPRSWDRQNLWHGDSEHEQQYCAEPKESANFEYVELLRESRPTDGEGNAPSIADRE